MQVLQMATDRPLHATSSWCQCGLMGMGALKCLNPSESVFYVAPRVGVLPGLKGVEAKVEVAMPAPLLIIDALLFLQHEFTHALCTGLESKIEG